MVTKAVEKADKAETVERLTAEAARPKKPAGSPALKPYQAAGRRERAAFDRRLGQILRTMPQIDQAQKDLGLADGEDIDGASLTPDQQARMLELKASAEELAADIEDAFRPLLVEPSDAPWLEAAPINELMNLFSWYVAVMQPGEAKPSSV